MIVLADDSYGHQRLTFDSVADWAADRYGIGISRTTITVDDPLKDVDWKDVTIKIWKNYHIGYQIKNEKFHRSHFRKIGLMGTKSNCPNKSGGILIGLSEDKVYPIGSCQQKDKTAISRLRNVLCTWIGLQNDDPFDQYNTGDGWKPAFKLIDDRNNADERAKAKAVHVEYTGDRDHDDQDDADLD